MREPDNPFAPGEDKSARSSGPAYVAWYCTVAAVIVAAVFFVLWQKTRKSQQQGMQILQSELDKTAADLSKALATVQSNQVVLGELTNQVAVLQKEKEMAGQMARNLEDDMRQQLESRDVKISKLEGKLTVTIVDRVMFDSGEAVLKPDGAAVMQKIADLLSTHPEVKIHVVGHTDNVPIRQNAQSRFASNWELSAARALAAVHFLTEKAGVDPRRVGAVGYGEFHPIADNDTAEGRARNRRIEVIVLPEEVQQAQSAIPDPKQPAN